MDMQPVSLLHYYLGVDRWDQQTNKQNLECYHVSMRPAASALHAALILVGALLFLFSHVP